MRSTNGKGRYIEASSELTDTGTRLNERKENQTLDKREEMIDFGEGSGGPREFGYSTAGGTVTTSPLRYLYSTVPSAFCLVTSTSVPLWYHSVSPVLSH
jgi:hypothetical protein